MQNPFKGISAVIPSPFTVGDEVDEELKSITLKGIHCE